jgi:tetratricopeptide (TPR) repeat protein
MPAGMEWSMLSKDEKIRLRSLSKEHAENIGLHMLAAYSLEESEPEQALEHAQWVARQASRIDIARETLAFISYRAGDYKTALKEFRTARRMNGQIDYLPFIADCERGLGHPQKAIDIALSDDAKDLEGDSKAEMLLVFAGAYSDLGQIDQAIKIVDMLSKSKGVSGGYRMRAVQAEQNFLDQAGRHEDSLTLDSELDRLEEAYADADEEDEEEPVIDNDLEEVPDSILAGLGIDPHDFSYQFPEEADAEGSSEAEPKAATKPAPNFGDPANATVAGNETPWAPGVMSA